MTDLKPCPFCPDGGAPAILSATNDHQPSCKQCWLHLASCRTREEATELWNRRPSPWIRCAERMPEADKDVLFVWAPGPEGRLVEKGRWFPGECFEDDSGNSVSVAFVTHWMPLPELPEDAG